MISFERLEAKAVERGCRTFMLETGPTQPEALLLYERLGYQYCGPFGDYPADPLSVFMQKQADPRAGQSRAAPSHTAPTSASRS